MSNDNLRQIVLDTETTGLEHSAGHRIIEIGCVELIDRQLTGNNLHRYLQPDREIDEGAIEVHGITNEFLLDKPRFADIVGEMMDYLRGAELIIHNAPFDVGFLNAELRRIKPSPGTIEDHCTVTDTLTMARRKHPGQRNSLDALCKRYGIDNSGRDLHGALLDAELLADVYLFMTGGQVTLSLSGMEDADGNQGDNTGIRRLSGDRALLEVVRANKNELDAHAGMLESIAKASGGQCLWTTQ
jgi:DNA polymerase-3 subunit epsilon